MEYVEGRSLRDALDRTVLFSRQGLQAFPPVVLRQVRTTDIAARVLRVVVVVVVDNLMAAGHAVMPIIASDPAIDPR